MEGRLLEVYQREHKIAETLQRSLLPERLPQIDGLRAGRPLPARRSRRRDRRRLVRRARAPRRPRGAGGGRRGRPRPARRRDDGPAPQRLPRLRPRRVLAGRGGGAHQPARDERRGGRHGHRASTSCSTARPARCPSARAGHPPPLVLAPDGPHFLEGGRSVPIGAADPAVFREASAVLPPGSSLLLYTDGLVERRDVALERAPRRSSRRWPVRAGDDLDALCDARDRAACSASGEPGDDVALLAVRPLPAASRAHQPDAARRAGVARRACGGAWRASCTPRAHRDAEHYEITLTICEAAGNAIEHAYGPGDATFEVEVTFANGELVATVRDSGSWRERARRAPRPRPQHHRGADGRG